MTDTEPEVVRLVYVAGRSILLDPGQVAELRDALTDWLDTHDESKLR